MTDQATAERYGVAVDVLADGTLVAVRIEESITPYGLQLGNLISALAREALDEARSTVRERISELSSDSRIAAAVEAIERASEQRPAPTPAEIAVLQRDPDDDLSEEELIELNERRNQSWFR
ncbi:hypothetical protein ACWDYH_08825 [Nocardia goodfellowii]